MAVVPVREHPLRRSGFAESPAEAQRNTKRTHKCVQTSALQLAVLPGSTAGPAQARRRGPAGEDPRTWPHRFIGVNSVPEEEDLKKPPETPRMPQTFPGHRSMSPRT